MKNKKFILIIIILLVLMAIGYYGLQMKGKKGFFKEQSPTDALTFKEDYESLNGTKFTYKEVEYTWSTVEINEDNNMVALTFDEVRELLNNGTGILYFSRSTCPWCRLLTPIVIDFANDINENIYYYNVVPDRDKNNDNYQELITKLYDILPLDTYTQSEDDPDFDETKHGIVQPMLFFIKDGKVVGHIYAFQHEYLQNNEIQRMSNLIGDAYEKMVN